MQIFLFVLKFLIKNFGKLKKLKHIKQLGSKDCGPTCLKIVANWYGKNYDINYLRKICNINDAGVNMVDLKHAAEDIGFRTLCVKIDITKLDKVLIKEQCIIIHWQKKHFVVLYKLRKSFFLRKNRYYISDPARGCLRLNKDDFCVAWKGNSKKGYCMFLEPDEGFYVK